MSENGRYRFVMSFVFFAIGALLVWEGAPYHAATFWYMSGYLLGSADPESQNWDAFNPPEEEG